MRRCLIDTGPFVAYLDHADPAHERVAARLDAFSGKLLTTSAVVTETMYFVSDSPDGPEAFAELLLRSDVEVVEAAQPPQVLAAALLMRKYRDTPMDFADATLVALGEEVGVADIFTLDRRGFSIYRTSAGGRFRLLIDTRAK